MKRITALATCFVLLMAMAAFAQATKTATKKAAPKVAVAKAVQTTGTIVSADAMNLVIMHKGTTGAQEQMTFALDTATKKTGDMVKDAKVTVHYTVDGTTFKATSVTATAPKPAAAKKAVKK
jgi:hypothetical protein